MKKLYFTIMAIIGMTAVSSAQYVDNALLFSQHNYGSTARSKAMGNAFGALGGDFGSLSINPAGIGIYQRGEVSTTISLLNQNATETTYQGNSNKDNNNNFNFKNFGYISTIPGSANNSGLVSINFGIGYNRIANFNQNSFVSTESSAYSRMDAFAQQTNGINYNNLVSTDGYDPYQSSIPWESKLAWENYLIDVTNSSTTGDNYATFLLDNEKVKQREAASREGFINEYLASFGANFNHNLYLGASIGMQDLFYDEAKVYSEFGIDEAGTNLKSWGHYDYTNNTRSTGVGYNLKLGAIYRPLPALRIGLAFHTPTYFHIKETYSSSMNSNLVGISTQSDGAHKESTPIGSFEYNFHSPLRAIASVAYQFGKKAMFSMDYEFVDYSSSKFSHGFADDFSVENGDIKSVYKSVSNVRLGAEYRLTDAFSLRGGLEFLGNPYKSSAYGVSQPNMDYKFTTYNGGFGYRSGKYSLDVTYSVGDKTNYMYLYHIDGVNVDPVKYHNMNSEVLFTFAIRM